MASLLAANLAQHALASLDLASVSYVLAPTSLTAGSNSFGATYYKGPKKSGSSLTFKLYALSGRLELQRGASRDDVIKAMKGKVLGANSLRPKQCDPAPAHL